MLFLVHFYNVDVSSILVGNEDLPNGEWTPYEYNGMMLGPNGIELVRGTNGAAAEYLLVGLSLRQPSLYRVHIASKTVELVDVQDVDGIWAGNVGIDGLRFASDGSLAAMTYMNSGAVLGVLRLTSADMWASASIVGVDRAPAPEGLMRTTLAYTENSATWVIATSFEGKSPVQISEVAFTSTMATVLPVNVMNAGAPESFTRDTKRGQWVLGSMFAPVFTVVDDMGAVVETRDISSVTDGFTTVGGTIFMFVAI